jgi:hypothetical protein
MAVCGAKLHGSEGTCRQPGMANGRCRLHGGKALAGTASPTFKHGRYSKVVARALAPPHPPVRVELPPEMQAEDDLLVQSIRQALQELRQAEHKVAEWTRALESAYRAGDTAAVQDLLKQAKTVVPPGHSEARLWTEIRRFILARQRAADLRLDAPISGGLLVQRNDMRQFAAQVRAALRRSPLFPEDRDAIAAETGLLTWIERP